MSETAPEGGVLPSGETEVANSTDVPEPVLTSTDWKPESAAKTIADLRRENAGTRTRLREQEQRDEQFRKTVAKALGLTQDEPDPAELTNQLTKAQSDARQRTVELAVLRAAGRAGVNGDALLDSRSFYDSVNSLDPAAQDFGELVASAIAAAAQQNTGPAARPPAPARSGGEFSTAPTAAQQWSMQDIERATPDQINEARSKGLLQNLGFGPG